MAIAGYARERRLLQVAVFIAAGVPVAAGGWGMIKGTALFDVGNLSLDSHFRYLSGLLCGLGLNFWMIIPGIEKHTGILRALTFMVVLGGLARLMEAVMVVMPPLPMQLALLMELGVTPLVCLWQTRLVRLAARS